MLDNREVKAMAGSAEQVAARGKEVRAKWRRARVLDETERIRELEAVVDEITEVMRPVRRAMGQLAFLRLETGLEDRLRKASDEAQRERRKVRKMLNASKRPASAR